MKCETFIVTRAVTLGGLIESSKFAYYAWHVQGEYEIELLDNSLTEVIRKMNTMGYALTATKGESTYYFTKVINDD